MHIPASFVDVVSPNAQLDPNEAVSVARLAYLTADLDFEEYESERGVLEEIAALLHVDGGIDALPPISPLPLDDEERRARIRELASGLTTVGGRELAYALAYVLAVSDSELAPVESSFLEELQQALGLDDNRAAELAATAASEVTPGVRENDRVR